MDLAILNSSYKRKKLVENWNSLVWTERHLSNGDFQMVSNNISEVLDLLPLGDIDDPPLLVGIEDSDVPMVVEDHKISKSKQGIQQVTTTGRSFETVLERRTNVKTTGTTVAEDGATGALKRLQYTITAQTAAVAAYDLIKDFIVDGEVTTDDIIPEIDLVNAATMVGVSEPYAVDPKDLYTWAIETLALGKFGLRSQVGVVPNKISVIIYEGRDRTEDIVFDVALDQFDQADYLLSLKQAKNVMQVSSAHRLETTSMGSVGTGLARRVGFLNLESDITVPTNLSGLATALANRGKVALADLLPTQLFSGGVSANIGDKYNADDGYALGDLVTLQGEYGLSQVARVAEFVRTQDTTGTKSYPTFEAVT